MHQCNLCREKWVLANERLRDSIYAAMRENNPSAAAYVLSRGWTHGRNRHEAYALATIIDAGQAGDLGLVLEIATRRLAGLQEVDGGKDWSLLHALEIKPMRGSLVGKGALNRALLVAERSKKMSAKVRSSTQEEKDGTRRPQAAGGRR